MLPSSWRSATQSHKLCSTWLEFWGICVYKKFKVTVETWRWELLQCFNKEIKKVMKILTPDSQFPITIQTKQSQSNSLSLCWTYSVICKSIYLIKKKNWWSCNVPAFLFEMISVWVFARTQEILNWDFTQPNLAVARIQTMVLLSLSLTHTCTSVCVCVYPVWNLNFCSGTEQDGLEITH